MSLWNPTHLLSVHELGRGPELCVEVMLVHHRVLDLGAVAAYTEAEWRAQVPPMWARTPMGRWLRRHGRRMVAFQGRVVELPVPPIPREARGMPRRFLLVDDDPNVAEALARSVRVRTKAWMPVVAPSAIEALKQADVVSMQGIVSDRAMPDMDGRDLLLEFRKRHPEAVRILLTGSGSVSEFSGAHRVLRKPCPASVIVATLAAVLPLVA